MVQICAPSQVFSVLAVISIVIYLINMFTSLNIRTVDVTDYIYKTDAINNAYAALAVKIVMLILYGYVLQVLCDNKLERVAWIILLFPFLLIGFLVLYSTSVGLISAVRGNGFSVGGDRHDKIGCGSGFSVGGAFTSGGAHGSHEDKKLVHTTP